MISGFLFFFFVSDANWMNAYFDRLCIADEMFKPLHFGFDPWPACHYAGNLNTGILSLIIYAIQKIQEMIFFSFKTVH